MTAVIQPGKIVGEISAIPSKSHLHRQLIYAALADKKTLIKCAPTEAEDIFATANCLRALGAEISKNENGFCVSPTEKKFSREKKIRFPVCESGSTLRFMLPIVSALGINGAFEMKGRLPRRPLAPLDALLQNHGIKITRPAENILSVEGQLTAGDFVLPGDVSSQYISGLMMALPLLDSPSKITVTPPIESADYIEMTSQTAKEFSCEISSRVNEKNETEYEIIPRALKSCGETETEGDWSNGAFWLCAGAMHGGDVQLRGLRKNSKQGDKFIFDILRDAGANIFYENEIIFSRENNRKFSEIDARAIPDLIPVLAAVASVGEGTTIFTNAARLRLKESDRLKATAETLSILGANIRETADGLIVKTVPSLRGGVVDSFGDHRIAMMAAIASAACDAPVTINGAHAVNKSYPNFWNDLRTLGKTVEI
jgi:3-phosphoshikimate 1-carboxyvinyltransferase